MINLIDNVFDQKWSEVQNLILNWHLKNSQDRNPHSRKRTDEYYYRELRNLNIIELEKLYQFTFKKWLIDKYSQKVDDLLGSFICLYNINYDFNSNHVNEPETISLICQKPNAIEILQYMFLTLEFPYKNLYQLKNPLATPPYVEIDFDSPLFIFLLENHEKYSLRYSPLFWAIENERTDLIENILTIKPNWLQVQNESGLTPLMFAIEKIKEKSLIKLIEFKPDAHQVNLKKETIAHVLCRSSDINWILKLKNDTNFSYLDIQQMLLDPNLKDINNIIPLGYAIYKEHFNFVKELYECSDVLQAVFLPFYIDAITRFNTRYLDFLYHDLKINIFANEHQNLLCQLVVISINSVYTGVYDWFIRSNELDSNLRQVFLMYFCLRQRNFELFLPFLKMHGLNWNTITPEMCFSITKLLIHEAQGQLIVDTRLFDLHPNFHRLLCMTSNNILESVISVVEAATTFFNVPIEKYHSLLNYYLDYLDRHPKEYPQWLGADDNHLAFVLTHLPMNKNRLVNGEPLFHYLENYYYTLSLNNSDINLAKKLTDFVDFKVNLNAFDQNNQHLFAKLINDSPAGFERIQKLKALFPQISLENLDSKGSNLLHLAIELKHQKCISWCLKSNFDVCVQRSFDNQSPMEMVFEMQNFELFDLMRKFVKKSQFIDYLEQLIKQQKESILEYIFSIVKPFGWEFTTHHQALLRKIPNEIIQRFLKQFEKKAEIKTLPAVEEIKLVEKPAGVKEKSKIILNHEILLRFIHEANVKLFEELLDASYKEILETLFKDNFLSYLTAVFQSPSKNLNKIFIRFPETQFYMSNSDDCHWLFSESLEKGNQIVIDNMLGREFVLKILKTQGLRHLKVALTSQPEVIGKQLLSIFELSLEESYDLLGHLLTQNNSNGILTFFEKDNHRQLLKDLSVETWIMLFKQESVMQNLFKFTEVQRYFQKQLFPCFYKLIDENQSNAVQLILTLPKYRTKLLDNKTLVDKLESTEMFSLIVPFLSLELLEDIFSKAIADKNLDIIQKIVSYSSLKEYLQADAKRYLKEALLLYPEVCHEILFDIFPLNMEDLNSIWLFTLALEDAQALISFLSVQAHHDFVKNASLAVWKIILNKGIKVTEFILSHEDLESYFSKHLLNLFWSALQENNLLVLENIFHFASLKTKISANKDAFLGTMESLKIMHRWVSVVQAMDDIPWDLFFISALQTNKQHVVVHMLNNEKVREYLQLNAQTYLLVALDTYPKVWSDMLFDAFHLDANNLNNIWQHCLSQQNREALLFLLRRQESYLFLEKASSEIWMQLLSNDIVLTDTLLASPVLEPLIHAQIIPCFIKALKENDLLVLTMILYFPNLRAIVKDNAKSILRQAKSLGLLNSLMLIWSSYQSDFSSFMLPYVPVLKVDLTVDVKEAFTNLTSETGITYLVGSAVHSLIYGTSLEFINDVDFISTQEPAPDKGFMPSRVQPKLFFSSVLMKAPCQSYASKILKIECYVKEHDVEHFIAEDFEERDFTVNCLYANADGDIFDPTGQGLFDLQHRLIRCVKNNPAESFEQDPIRILRTIRLVVKGFQLTPSVSQAIYEWKPNERVNFGHVYAMTKTLLSSEYKENIFGLLKHFDLLKKLLRYEVQKPDLKSLKEFINSEVARRDKYSPSNRRSPPGFFNPPSLELNSSPNVHNGHNTSGNFFNGI